MHASSQAEERRIKGLPMQWIAFFCCGCRVPAALFLAQSSRRADHCPRTQRHIPSIPDSRVKASTCCTQVIPQHLVENVERGCAKRPFLSSARSCGSRGQAHPARGPARRMALSSFLALRILLCLACAAAASIGGPRATAVPAKTVGFYVLCADDTDPTYTSLTNWTPMLPPYLEVRCVVLPFESLDHTEADDADLLCSFF